MSASSCAAACSPLARRLATGSLAKATSYHSITVSGSTMPCLALKMNQGFPDASAYRRRFANMGETYRSFALAGPGFFVNMHPRMIASAESGSCSEVAVSVVHSSLGALPLVCPALDEPEAPALLVGMLDRACSQEIANGLSGTGRTVPEQAEAIELGGRFDRTDAPILASTGVTLDRGIDVILTRL